MHYWGAWHVSEESGQLSARVVRHDKDDRQWLESSGLRVQVDSFREQLQRVPQTCRGVQGDICPAGDRRLQDPNIEDLYELSAKMYFYSYQRN